MRYIVFSDEEMKLLKIHSSDDPGRYPLNGIHFSKTQNKVISCDGRRMILLKKKIPEKLKGKTVEMPVLGKNQSCVIDSVQKKWLLFFAHNYKEVSNKFYKVKDKKLSNKLIDSLTDSHNTVIFIDKDYFKYKAVIPKYDKNAFEIRFNPQLMVDGYDYQLRMKGNLKAAHGTMQLLDYGDDLVEVVIMPMEIMETNRGMKK